MFLRVCAANIDFNQSVFQFYVFENDVPVIETTEITLWRIADTNDIINVIKILKCITYFIFHD